MKLPRLVTVRQKFQDRRIKDIPASVQRTLSEAEFDSRMRPGSSIAIGVGSRGISNIAEIVCAVVDFWKVRAMKPFIFPAMGSHGAATAEGQSAVLAKYGITEERTGCPIRSSLEVVALGETTEGIPAFMDKNAYQADGVMLVGRVKWHTDFAGKLESGLFKMMAIGIGKFAGARLYHTYAYRLGLEHVIRSVGRKVLGSGKMLGGLAILEDAYHNTAQLTAVPVNCMEQREEELLATVKSWMGRIPFDLDLLILDEIGKNISGAGMDTKVVNRGVQGEYNPWPEAPRIERIYVRDITPLSYGNAVGVGMADVVSDRLLAKIDWNATHINALTASTPATARIPIHFPSDRECVEAILTTLGRVNISEATIGWIKNSLELDAIALSENLLEQIRKNPMLEVIQPAREMDFDSAGNFAEPAYAVSAEREAALMSSPAH